MDNKKSLIQEFYESDRLDRTEAGKRSDKEARELKKFGGKNNLVLDAGCGNGIVAELIAKEGNRVIGTDISQKNIALARNRNIEAIQHDLVQPFPFRDETFDRICCLGVLEHLFLPERALREIYRCLKKDGQILIYTANDAFWRNRVVFLWGRMLFVETINNKLWPWEHPHIRFFNLSYLKKLLTRCNFRITAIKAAYVDFPGALIPYVPFPVKVILYLLQRITHGCEFLSNIFPSLFSGSLSAYAEKK